MTLKELLNKVEFDDIIPFVKKHYPHTAHCMAGFKMAFDGMRNTIPSSASDEVVNIELYKEENEEPYIMVCHVDNDIWENVVGREICISSEVSASLEEIVAVVMYDATYFGFTPTDRDETFEEWEIGQKPPKNGNPYRMAWWHLTQKKHDFFCRKEDIGQRNYTLNIDHPFRNIYSKQMNRSKRKRVYRWDKRIDHLERLANRWDLLQKNKNAANSIAGDYTKRAIALFEADLFKAELCDVSRMEDFSINNVGLHYIYELMTKYDSSYPRESLTCLWFQSPKEIDVEAAKNICMLVGHPLPIVQRNVQKLENETDRSSVIHEIRRK